MLEKVDGFTRLTAAGFSSRDALRGAGVAALLGVLGGVALIFAHGETLVRLVGAAFLACAFLVAFGTIAQMRARSAPASFVELASPKLRRGQTVRIAVVQQGPLHAESLRLNLIGDSHWRERLRRHHHNRSEHVATILVLEEGQLSISDEWRGEAALELPQEVKPSGFDGKKRTEWQLELWVKRRDGADFRRAFPVEVL